MKWLVYEGKPSERDHAVAIAEGDTEIEARIDFILQHPRVFILCDRRPSEWGLVKVEEEGA